MLTILDEFSDAVITKFFLETWDFILNVTR